MGIQMESCGDGRQLLPIAHLGCRYSRRRPIVTARRKVYKINVRCSGSIVSPVAPGQSGELSNQRTHPREVLAAASGRLAPELVAASYMGTVLTENFI